MNVAPAARCATCGAESSPDGTCRICLLALGFAVAVGRENPEAVGSSVARLTIGMYRILDVLREDDRGIVYLAETRQAEGNRVALKLIKGDWGSRDWARLDHPNIARVTQEGVTEDGQRYVVAEWVKGVPIAEYCTSQKVPLAERLELFAQACDAIQHAHDRGWTHGDIKSTNALVTRAGDQAVVKIIDFGASADAASDVDRLHALRSVVLAGLPEAPRFEIRYESAGALAAGARDARPRSWAQKARGLFLRKRQEP